MRKPQQHRNNRHHSILKETIDGHLIEQIARPAATDEANVHQDHLRVIIFLVRWPMSRSP